jgi:hypothetical protein
MSRQCPPGVAAEEQGADARTPISGEDLSLLDALKPPGIHHLVAATRRAPAGRMMQGLRSGG